MSKVLRDKENKLSKMEIYKEIELSKKVSDKKENELSNMAMHNI